MEELIDTILGNQLYLGIAIGLLLLVAFSLLKKLLKLAVIVAGLLIAYLIYLAVTGQEPPAALEESLEKAGEKAAETVEEVIDAAKEADLDELKEKAESLLESAQRKPDD